MHVIGTHTLIGFSGELSDYQMILEELDKMMTKEYCADDGYKFCAQEIFSYMSRVMYGKRNEMNPYYNTLLIAGLDTKGESFLGMIDPVGTTLTDDEFATGYGLYLARPLMRKEKDERKKAGLGVRNLFCFGAFYRSLPVAMGFAFNRTCLKTRLRSTWKTVFALCTTATPEPATEFKWPR
jgi:20S proteasome alpha/beta subunit